jgi:hypothetical protein
MNAANSRRVFVLAQSNIAMAPVPDARAVAPTVRRTGA